MDDVADSMYKFLQFAKQHPDLFFKLTPNETYTNWDVEFTKGGYWWCAKPDDNETLVDTIKAASSYFDSLTDEIIQKRAKMENVQGMGECKEVTP